MDARAHQASAPDEPAGAHEHRTLHTRAGTERHRRALRRRHRPLPSRMDRGRHRAGAAYGSDRHGSGSRVDSADRVLRRHGPRTDLRSGLRRHTAPRVRLHPADLPPPHTRRRSRHRRVHRRRTCRRPQLPGPRAVTRRGRRRPGRLPSTSSQPRGRRLPGTAGPRRRRSRRDGTGARIRTVALRRAA